MLSVIGIDLHQHVLSNSTKEKISGQDDGVINHGLISRLHPLENLKYSKPYALKFGLKTVAFESPSAWRQSLPLNSSDLNTFFSNLALASNKY